MVYKFFRHTLCWLKRTPFSIDIFPNINSTRLDFPLILKLFLSFFIFCKVPLLSHTRLRHTTLLRTVQLTKIQLVPWTHFIRTPFSSVTSYSILVFVLPEVHVTSHQAWKCKIVKLYKNPLLHKLFIDVFSRHTVSDLILDLWVTVHF